MKKKLNQELFHTCNICGNKFKLLKENKYIAKKTNGLFSVPTIFECFDCPQCGCQSIVNIREEATEEVKDKKVENESRNSKNNRNN